MNNQNNSLGKPANRIFYLLLFVFALTTFQVQAAVQFETNRSVNDFTLGGIRTTPVTILSHPVGNGSDRALFVGISTLTTTAIAANRVVRVTFGAQSGCPIPSGMTASTCEFRRVNALATLTSDNQNAIELFVLVNPPSETRNIEISLLSAGVDYVVAGSASFTGVSQTAPHGNYQQSVGTAPTNQPFINVPDGISGEIIFDTLSLSFNAAAVADSQQTLLFEGNLSGGISDVGAGSIKADTSASVTDDVSMSWTINPAQWALGAVAIKQSVTSASPASIGGQVKSKDGEPVKNVLITLQNIQTGETFQTNTDEKGFYLFENLTLVNLYQIRAYNNFHNFSPNNRLLNLTESLEGVDFQATRRDRKKWFIRQ